MKPTKQWTVYKSWNNLKWDHDKVTKFAQKQLVLEKKTGFNSSVKCIASRYICRSQSTLHRHERDYGTIIVSHYSDRTILAVNY